MLILPWKLLFVYIIFLGTMIAVSASSWFSAWIGLEINMLGLLALFMSFKSPRNSEATLKYFLIQALASAILICSALSGSMVFSFLSSLDLFSIFILISLLIKMGAAPFHLWVPQIIEGLTWFNLMVVLSWQKIAPFILLLFILESPSSNKSFYLMTFSIILSAILGAYGGLAQISTRKMIAFSSINHMGWMLIAIMKSTFLWVCYFSFYSAILFALLMIMAEFNLSSLSQTSISMSPITQLGLYLSLFSFGGLPPFSGFIPKWLVINNITSSPLILLILVTTSLVTLFFYLRIANQSFLQKSKILASSTMKKDKSMWISLSFFINLSGLIMTPLIFSYV